MKIVKNIILMILYIICLPILALIMFFFYLISLVNWDNLESTNVWKINEKLNDVCNKLTFYMDDDEY